MFVRLTMAVLLVFALTSKVAARQFVSVTVLEGGSTPCGGQETIHGFAPGEDIDLPLSLCAYQVDIFAFPAADTDIGRVTLRGGRTDGVLLNINIGDVPVGAFNVDDEEGPVGCRDFGGLDVSQLNSPASTQVTGTIAGNLTGSLTVGRLYRLDVYGSVQSAISGNQLGAGSGGGVFEIGSISTDGSITLTQGSIRRVYAYSSAGIAGPIRALGANPGNPLGSIVALRTFNGGNLTAEVEARTSFITEINIAGTIGTSDAPVPIKCEDGIGAIEAQAIHARIEANRNFAAPQSPTNGSMNRLWARGGAFTGSLDAYALNQATIDGLVVSGAMSANVTFRESIHSDITAASVSGSITIEQNVLGGSPITMGSMGASGLIRISGFLGSPITVSSILAGDIEIAGPAYPAQSISATFISGTSHIKVGALCEVNGVGARITTPNEMAGDVSITGVPSSTPCFGVGIAQGAGISAASFASASTIAIRGIFHGSIVSEADKGFAGQVIVNQEGLAPPLHLGRWASSGKLQVGAVTIQPGAPDPLNAAPYYARDSASIGGGAIGLAPFHLYKSDCEPPSDSHVLRNDFEPDPDDPTGIPNGAVVRFYGPVVLNGSIGPLPVVEKRNPDGTNEWMPLPGFQVTVNPSNADYPGRSVRIRYSGSAGMLGPGRYRLRTIDSGLVCAGVVGTPPTYVDDTSAELEDAAYYHFNIVLDCNHNGMGDADDFLTSTPCSPGDGDCDGNEICDECDLFFDRAFRDRDGNNVLDSCKPCACDWNMSGTVNSQDFFDYLASFFQGNGDFNGDGVTNSQDFFDFLNCFFMGC